MDIVKEEDLEAGIFKNLNVMLKCYHPQSLEVALYDENDETREEIFTLRRVEDAGEYFFVCLQKPGVSLWRVPAVLTSSKITINVMERIIIVEGKVLNSYVLYRHGDTLDVIIGINPRPHFLASGYGISMYEESTYVEAS